MPRTFATDGVNLAFDSLPEIRDKIVVEGKRHARRQKAAKGELRGAAYAMNSLILYFLRLPRTERDRIIDEGREMLNRRFDTDEDEPLEEWKAMPSLPVKSLTSVGLPPLNSPGDLLDGQWGKDQDSATKGGDRPSPKTRVRRKK